MNDEPKTPTGRLVWPLTFKPCPASQEPTKLRDVETGPHPLAEVDYSRIERRVLVMGGRGHSKTLAMLEQMKAYCEADVKLAMGVPADMLGEDQGPLTGDELRSIMEGQPPWVEPEPERPSKNPFAQGSIKRFTK
ncbi:hypothetical protein RDJLphi1_gp54 [Roseobacter phage RDJL Phi 1]|uniref:Uncharacterized protein n=1 Tax=Roseobacter phage RDJL Phi 1 TaxID=562742 RepID=F4YXR5_9CAUD|nr:hypothetical protein RDJLphi1_gp54 [Roseobacter phage RDJL Phi 1]ADK73455.1 hypothetical protein RDJLphi1_gp54 [Roseobacter phage RDJL Phi 1]